MTEINLGRNILWTVVSRFGAQIVAVISNLLLARYLGGTGFGEYAFISAVVLIGNAFSTFGMDMVLIRKISSTQDYSDLPAALAIQLLISFIFIVSIFVLAPSLPAGNSLRIYIFSLIPLSFFTVFTIALRGTQFMGSFSLLHFLVALFQMASVFILLVLKGGIEYLVILLLGVQVFGALFGFILCIAQLKDFPRHWHLDWSKIPHLLTSSMQMAVIGTLRLVYEKLAVTMLPILVGMDITGLFSASARVLDASKLGHMSALSAMFPEMAREKNITTHLKHVTLSDSEGPLPAKARDSSVANDAPAERYGVFEADSLNAIKKNYYMLFLVAILLSFGLFFFSKLIIYLLFGEEFAASVETLQIMAWIILPYFIVTYYSLAFVAIQIEKPVLITLSASLFLLAILLIWWGPLYGLRGAAFAILCAEIFQAIFLWFQWRLYAFSKCS